MGAVGDGGAHDGGAVFWEAKSQQMVVVGDAERTSWSLVFAAGAIHNGEEPNICCPVQSAVLASKFCSVVRKFQRRWGVKTVSPQQNIGNAISGLVISTT